MREDGKLDYLEMPGGDMAATRDFYSQAFGWKFQDYGPTYSAFSEGLDGGFDGDLQRGGSPLPVLYAHDLEGIAARVESAGGVIVEPIFDFPGGRRFHFRDPAGNTLAVWSET